MDDKYEQQFMQNVRQGATTKATRPTSASQVVTDNTVTTTKTPLTIALVLGVIVLFESIALVMLIANMSSNYGDEVTIADYQVEDEGNPVYTYDDNDRLSAFALTCISINDDKFTFDKENRFEEYDKMSNLLSSGTYKIINEAAVVLNDGYNNERVVYYDGPSIVDGTTFYECQEDL